MFYLQARSSRTVRCDERNEGCEHVPLQDIHIYIYIYIYTYTHTHIHMYTYIYTYIYIYVHNIISTICIRIYIYIYIYTIDVYVYIYLYIYISISLSLSLSIYIYIYLQGVAVVGDALRLTFQADPGLLAGDVVVLGPEVVCVSDCTAEQLASVRGLHPYGGQEGFAEVPSERTLGHVVERVSPQDPLVWAASFPMGSPPPVLSAAGASWYSSNRLETAEEVMSLVPQSGYVVCWDMYIYIYIYTERERERDYIRIYIYIYIYST